MLRQSSSVSVQRYADTKMKEHPAVDVRRQTPHPLAKTRLPESHPVDGDRPTFRFYLNKRKKLLSSLTLTVCHKQNGPA